MKNKKLLLLLSILFILCIGCFIYAGDYYHATDEVQQVLIDSPEVTVHTLEDHNIVFEPKEIQAGFIFYPGAKVEYTAYAPLLHELAENNILCILVKMPLNLAILDINAANGLQALYPEVKDWYIGGHSLGGAMAASYVENHLDTFDGLVLLASYSTTDLSTSNLNIISIYGSNDQVLNAEKYATYKSYLPDDFKEYILEGGSHAYFGSYGLQEGDGTATISNEEQIKLTTDILIENFK